MFKSFLKLNKELWQNRKIVYAMGKTEFRNEYVGSALGIVWGVLKPFMMVVVYAIVFGGNLNSGIPFLAWLVPGLFFWTFLSDSLVAGTGAIRNSGHLVKKVVFPISILPSVKIFSNLLNHLIFMAFAIIIIIFLGQPLYIQSIQIVYYLFAGIVFTIGITRLLSAMAVMSVDIVHFIMTIMQLLFWASPVIWGTMAPRNGIEKLMMVLRLNPYFYLLEGYRDSLFSHKWFFQDPYAMLYFWGVTLVIYLLGSYYYQKNREEFADVL